MAKFMRSIGCAAAMTFLSLGPAPAATLKTIYSISGSFDGATSVAGLLYYKNNTVYGTTKFGGQHNAGTVFSYNTVTGKESVVYSFAGYGQPGSPLITLGGLLYGITGSGIVFSIDPSTGQEKDICVVSGFSSSALINVGGLLYGTTANGGPHKAGTVFSVDPVTGSLTVLYLFNGGNDGRHPQAGLIDVGGVLYGTTALGGPSNNGTVFSFDPATGSEKVIYSFAGGRDGANPQAELIAVDGILYGTTTAGGLSSNGSVSNVGTAFAVDITTGAEKVLHSFGDSANADGAMPPAALINVAGTLFGTTTSGGTYGKGTVYSINRATGAEKIVYSFESGTNGSHPDAKLTYVSGQLYGTTASVGQYGNGTVFTVDPTTGVEKDLHAFEGFPPSSSNNLLNVNGTLFLSTSAGGSAGRGSIVKIIPTTGMATEVYDFVGGDTGANPLASLISVGGNILYGTTSVGGMFDQGTVFSINADSGAEAVLHSFAGGTDGAFPSASLINLHNVLYGTTMLGGSTNNNGTAFSVNPATGAESVLHRFGGSPDGYHPKAAMINVGGQLYGTARDNQGVIYTINPATGVEKVLHNFKTMNDGYMPVAPLLYFRSTLFGTTLQSNIEGSGAVFSFNPATQAEKVIYYVGSEAALTNLGGTFYGTTIAPSTPSGAVFTINPTTGAEAEIYSFTGGSDGGSPNAAMVSISNKLYGTTSTGGANGVGTVFELTP